MVFTEVYVKYLIERLSLTNQQNMHIRGQQLQIVLSLQGLQDGIRMW